MSKKDGPARYLAGLLARVKYYTGEPPPVSKTFEGISIPPGGLFSDPINWEPVRAAFMALRLDARKAHDWEVLLCELASAHFGKRSHKPKIWEGPTLHQLWADYTRMRVRFAGKSQREICEILVTDYSHYKHSNAGTIRRKLPEARQAFIEMAMEYKEAWIKEEGSASWTPERERRWAALIAKEWRLGLSGVETLSDLWSE
jgi:hypothetical protein